MSFLDVYIINDYRHSWALFFLIKKLKDNVLLITSCNKEIIKNKMLYEFLPFVVHVIGIGWAGSAK